MEIQSQSLNESFALISELTKLKCVFRNTQTTADRKESTAEHSWSASMIIMVLLNELKQEFGAFNEYKTLQLMLIHDIVEIYAGDVIAFDTQARKNKEIIETQALQKLIELAPSFGELLEPLWLEFEKGHTLEAKIAKAADSICPIFQRLQTHHSYIPINVNISQLDETKLPKFEFSKTFLSLYHRLKKELLDKNLIIG